MASKNIVQQTLILNNYILIQIILPRINKRFFFLWEKYHKIQGNSLVGSTDFDITSVDLRHICLFYDIIIFVFTKVSKVLVFCLQLAVLPITYTFMNLLGTGLV